MSPAEWLSLATICALGAISPGPSLAVVLRNTLAGGQRAGIATGLAHALGIGCYALAVALGLAVVLHALPGTFATLRLAGTLFLAWLGVQSLRRAGGVFRAVGDGRRSLGPALAARDGFLIAFLNPKIALWFLALFSQFVAPESPLGIKLAMAGLAAAIDGAWYTLVALTVSIGAVLRPLERHAVWIDRAFGVLLLALAARLLVTT